MMESVRYAVSLFDSGIRPALDAHLLALSKQKRDYGDYWSASSAGYCMRKVIFERLGVPHVEKEDDARKQRVFTVGHLFHDWIQEITKASGQSIAQEVELQDEDLMVRGHFDDLVLVPYKDWEEHLDNDSERLILYDYKTVNSRSFLWAKKNGNAMSYYHKMQLGTYMYMLRNKAAAIFKVTNTSLYQGLEEMLPNLTEARILKIEKENLMMMEQQLLWSPELESEVLDYWNSLNAYWKNKKLPECSCEAQEGGFMAKEQFNPFFYEGEPCSLKYYQEWKEEQL